MSDHEEKTLNEKVLNWKKAVASNSSRSNVLSYNQNKILFLSIPIISSILIKFHFVNSGLSDWQKDITPIALLREIESYQEGVDQFHTLLSFANFVVYMFIFFLFHVHSRKIKIFGVVLLGYEVISGALFVLLFYFALLPSALKHVDGDDFEFGLHMIAYGCGRSALVILSLYFFYLFAFSHQFSDQLKPASTWQKLASNWLQSASNHWIGRLILFYWYVFLCVVGVGAFGLGALFFI